VKIYCISWKDERWSADKETLKNINELINKNSTKKKGFIIRFNPQTIVLFFMYLLGCIFHGFIFCFKWLKAKLNKPTTKLR